jgi:hypothetical protein
VKLRRCRRRSDRRKRGWWWCRRHERSSSDKRGRKGSEGTKIKLRVLPKLSKEHNNSKPYRKV